MTRRLIIILLLLLPSIASATTWYVRPDTDGNGTDLTYGAADGTTYATAFDGFASISGIAAGDTVCLPGSDEPFFERLVTGTAGTTGRPVTYDGCGDTQALVWSAQGLSENRSFNSSRAAVSSIEYAWSTVSEGLYKKRIDVRALMLWEDATWLQPVDIDAASESTIISTLTAGQWGMKNNGDSTYRLYYKASSSSKSPTTAVIRCDFVPGTGGATTGIVMVNKDYQTIRNIEVRGHTTIPGQGARSLYISNASHILLDAVTFFRNQEGPSIICGTGCRDIEFRDLTQTYSSKTGAYIEPGATGISDLRIVRGTYSYSFDSYYNGTNFTTGDGDGFGIGQGGGVLRDVTFTGVTMNYNANAGIFVGTTNPMAVTNLTIRGATWIGNAHNCFGEAGVPTTQINGGLVIVGFLCQGTTATNTYSAMSFNPNTGTARTILLGNGTFVNNANFARIKWIPNANDTVAFRNLVFGPNTGTPTNDQGDFYSNITALTGTETFQNIWFYSLPNLDRRFARLGVANTSYLYNSGTDLAAFNSATGATGTHLNDDPLLTSTFSTQGSSPLRHAGIAYANCLGLRSRPCWNPPDIGAYQSTSGDPAATRTARQ